MAPVFEDNMIYMLMTIYLSKCRCNEQKVVLSFYILEMHICLQCFQLILRLYNRWTDAANVDELHLDERGSFLVQFVHKRWVDPRISDFGPQWVRFAPKRDEYFSENISLHYDSDFQI